MYLQTFVIKNNLFVINRD